MTFTPTIAPMYDNNEPNENSTLDELGAYALVKQTRIIANDKRNGEDLWLMGQALTWAFKKTPHGKWEKWFKAQGLAKTYVWQARTLYERATLAQVTNIGLTKALRKFKVVAEKKAKPEAATVPNAKKTNENGKAPASENPTDPLAEEDEKELKAFQDALRQPTPKTRAVAIQHALELLRDELNAEEVDEELQTTFGQIAELAQALKGLNKPTDAEEAA